MHACNPHRTIFSPAGASFSLIKLWNTIREAERLGGLFAFFGVSAERGSASSYISCFNDIERVCACVIIQCELEREREIRCCAALRQNRYVAPFFFTMKLSSHIIYIETWLQLIMFFSETVDRYRTLRRRPKKCYIIFKREKELFFLFLRNIYFCL